LARSAGSEKNHRKDVARRRRNISGLRTLRTAVRKVAETPADQVPEALDKAYSLLDRAGRKGLIHPRRADRIKSRITLRAKTQD